MRPSLRLSLTLALGLVATVAACDSGAVPATRDPSRSPVAATVAPTAVAPTGAPTAASSAPTGEPSQSPSGGPASPGFGEAPVGATEEATVVRVVDGDTIVVDRGLGEERLRYIGVDTPETVAPGSPVEWMGPEASAANKALVAGREVVLERDVSETDRFGRLLRYVWVRDESRPSGWLFVNLELLARGFAQVVTYPPDVRYVDLYLAAQAEAREQGLGLWGAEGPGESTAPQPSSGSGGGSCHPSYEGACLRVGIGDYDCAGGSGNGPNYIAGPIRVVGPDEFRLDGNGDGVACE